MKKRLVWSILLISVVVFALTIPRWEGAELLPLLQRIRTAQMRKASARTDTQLIAAGVPVLTGEDGYPQHLANPERLKAFCQGKANSAALLRRMDDGEVRQLLFLRQGTEVWFLVTELDPEYGSWVTTRFPVYDMVLSERNILYYRCYPEGDPHYIDYNQIRLEPVNRETYDLLLKYVYPVGYQMVNLFLTDWREGQWDQVSLTDTLESCYTMRTGEMLPWESWAGSTSKILVPGSVFEDAILPWFALSREKLREVCHYDARSDTYPWRPVHGDFLTTWGYPMCEPEVSAVRENSDGTITMEIRVYSPDQRGELLFSHELTIRQLGAGFQYAGNRVGYVSEYGLPVNIPRFQLDGT